MNKMRLFKIMSWVAGVALLLSACSRPIMVGSEPGIIGFNADYQPEVSEHYPSSRNGERYASEPAGLQEILVDAVIVDLGDGSPFPRVKISGTWPEPCSQLAEIKKTTSEDTFDIRLLAAPDKPACLSGSRGLSFGIDIPLNMAEKQPGTYTVSVNGKETSFEWDD